MRQHIVPRITLAAVLLWLVLSGASQAANFVLVRTGQGRKVFSAMQQHGVITRPMDGYQLPDWIRISVGTMARHCANSGPWRKPTVWSSSVSQKIISR
mgnify:CR=1 FL=1